MLLVARVEKLRSTSCKLKCEDWEANPLKYKNWEPNPVEIVKIQLTILLAGVLTPIRWSCSSCSTRGTRWSTNSNAADLVKE